MSNTIRVPVQNPDGNPAMPTKSSRARRWVDQGKAIPVRNDLDVYGIRLVSEHRAEPSKILFLALTQVSFSLGLV